MWVVQTSGSSVNCRYRCRGQCNGRLQGQVLTAGIGVEGSVMVDCRVKC